MMRLDGKLKEQAEMNRLVYIMPDRVLHKRLFFCVKVGPCPCK